MQNFMEAATAAALSAAQTTAAAPDARAQTNILIGNATANDAQAATSDKFSG